MIMMTPEDSVFPNIFDMYTDEPEPRDAGDAAFLSLMKGWI